MFSMVTANNPVVSTQVRLNVSDFRKGGWKGEEAIGSPCANRDAKTLIQKGPCLQPKINIWLLGLFHVRAGLFDAAFHQFGLHFRLLAPQQVNFRFKCPVTGQLDLDSMFSRTER